MPIISLLKSELQKGKIDFFLLENSDEFFLEYIPESEQRIKFLTNFTGSNATVIFGQNKSYFFTDGRYLLQAKNELNSKDFEIIDLTTESPSSWLQKNLKKGQNLAITAKLTSLKSFNSYQNVVDQKSAKLTVLTEDIVEKIWQDPPKQIRSEIFFLDEKITGETSLSKRQRIAQRITGDALLISKPENLCWLMNMRAADVNYTPIALAYAILFKDGRIDIFTDEKRFQNSKNFEAEKINVIQENCLDLRISVLSRLIKNVQIDEKNINYALYQSFKNSGLKISFASDPIEEEKAVKNNSEINSIINAHKIDGIAVTKFITWIKKSVKEGKKIDEISAAKKLLEYRQEAKSFYYPSFSTISAFAENGAIIHYQPSAKTNKNINGNSLYLLDSGGQYYDGETICGTTDITRTIAIGTPTADMIHDYTLVLKAHIALASAKFPKGTNGAQLDAIARNILWKNGKDYAHGTGHGVGHFLSVHEGPCGISRGYCHQKLVPGMILSNEPGFYKEGEYGIRLENLVLVEEFDENFLCFKNLTLVPFDEQLIDLAMLNSAEKQWLQDL